MISEKKNRGTRLGNDRMEKIKLMTLKSPSDLPKRHEHTSEDTSSPFYENRLKKKTGFKDIRTRVSFGKPLAGEGDNPQPFLHSCQIPSEKYENIVNLIHAILRDEPHGYTNGKESVEVLLDKKKKSRSPHRKGNKLKMNTQKKSHTDKKSKKHRKTKPVLHLSGHSLSDQRRSAQNKTSDECETFHEKMESIKAFIHQNNQLNPFQYNALNSSYFKHEDKPKDRSKEKAKSGSFKDKDDILNNLQKIKNKIDHLVSKKLINTVEAVTIMTCSEKLANDLKSTEKIYKRTLFKFDDLQSNLKKFYKKTKSQFPSKKRSRQRLADNYETKDLLCLKKELIRLANNYCKFSESGDHAVVISPESSDKERKVKENTGLAKIVLPTPKLRPEKKKVPVVEEDSVLCRMPQMLPKHGTIYIEPHSYEVQTVILKNKSTVSDIVDSRDEKSEPTSIETSLDYSEKEYIKKKICLKSNRRMNESQRSINKKLNDFFQKFKLKEVTDSDVVGNEEKNTQDKSALTDSYKSSSDEWLGDGVEEIDPRVNTILKHQKEELTEKNSTVSSRGNTMTTSSEMTSDVTESECPEKSEDEIERKSPTPIEISVNCVRQQIIPGSYRKSSSREWDDTRVIKRVGVSPTPSINPLKKLKIKIPKRLSKKQAKKNIESLFPNYEKMVKKEEGKDSERDIKSILEGKKKGQKDFPGKTYNKLAKLVRKVSKEDEIRKKFTRAENSVELARRKRNFKKTENSYNKQWTKSITAYVVKEETKTSRSHSNVEAVPGTSRDTLEDLKKRKQLMKEKKIPFTPTSDTEQKKGITIRNSESPQRKTDDDYEIEAVSKRDFMFLRKNPRENPLRGESSLVSGKLSFLRQASVVSDVVCASRSRLSEYSPMSSKSDMNADEDKTQVTEHLEEKSTMKNKKHNNKKK